MAPPGQSPRLAGESKRLLGEALGHHRAGRLEQAAQLYRRALERAPNESGILQALADIALRRGHRHEAIARLTQALRLDEQSARLNADLAILLAEDGKEPAAARQCRRTLALEPGFAEAAVTLAALMSRANRHDAALHAVAMALGVAPEHPRGLFNKGNVLKDIGRLDAAAQCYRKVLRRDGANAAAWHNLGHVLLDLGRQGEAIDSMTRAVAADPGEGKTWSGLGLALAGFRFVKSDSTYLALVQQALEHPALRPQDLFTAAYSLWRIGARDGLGDGDVSESDVSALAEDGLFVALIAQTLPAEPMLESLLVRLRRTLLGRVLGDGGIATPLLGLMIALATASFHAEHLWDESEEEASIVARLWARLESEPPRAAAGAALAIVGCYRPLAALANAEAWAALDSGEPLARLLRLTVREPLEERRRAASVRQLTPVRDVTSMAVRSQYEENPYPRWLRAPVEFEPMALRQVLQQQCPWLEPTELPEVERPCVLIAGCGTGQHAISAAMTYREAEILAIDLSRASLAYAARKAAELGLKQIRFAQADILELEDVRRFDVIESVGVLHHLADPLVGWRRLTGLLAERGFMRIGLYSRLARQPIDAARRLIAERGFAPDAAGIRRARAAILAEPAFQSIAEAGEFYSLSTCRDLLFHVQETDFDIDRIERALTTLGLEFLGFELTEAGLRERFCAFAGGASLIDLAQWRRFEEAFPATFRAMYVFWVRRQ